MLRFVEVSPRQRVWTAAPNRSLGSQARALCLLALGGSVAAVALFSVLVGAWPILPFAGVELAVLWLAFRCLARHDTDFERLELDGDRLTWRSQIAGCSHSMEANLPWVRLLVRDAGGRCCLALRYAGKTIRIGGLASEPGRRRWAAELGQRLSVIHLPQS